ncbi:MAG: hypothetical protein ACI4JE_03710 [Ruminococcus sp.]|nr:hypothetical protein [Oscillospiraceae bacterium]
MKKGIKRLLSVIFSAAVISCTAASLAVSADEPYDVYNYDRWGEAIPSQAGYISERAVTGNDLGIGHFNEPQDIFRDFNNIFYIADMGNNRVVAVNSDFDEVIKIYDSFKMPDGSTTTLKKPMGIFVSEQTGWLYIADSENSRVLISDLDGNVISEITKPTSEVFDQTKTFLPQRVIADKAGNVYIVLGNITTGAAMFNPDGEFMGFYGANRVEATAEIVGNYLKNLFTSETKKAHKARNIPTGITSFDIEGDFIFTCTSSTTQTTDTVKKLNSAGNNIFANKELAFGDYTPMYDSNTNTSYATKICDIDIADDGNINCLDFTTGRIFQYDEDCNLLFITGTIAKQQVGGFNQVAALESMGANLYVLDMMKNTVTIFTETSFGEIVHEAAAYYNAGQYEKALEPWYEVLRRDGNYRRAYIGVASALLNAGDYEGAMKYAKLADAPAIYNKAFEGYRMDFLDEHFTEIIIVLILLIIALVILSRHFKKKRLAREAAEIAERDERRKNAGKEEQAT